MNVKKKKKHADNDTVSYGGKHEHDPNYSGESIVA